MFRILVLLPVFALLAACQSVSVKTPVGTELVPAEAARWAGQWYNPDGSATIRIVDEAAGRMEAAFVEESDGAFKTQVWDLELRKAGDLLLLNYRTEEARTKGIWHWCRVRNDDGKTLVFWSPNFEAFKKLADEGRIAPDAGMTTKDELVFDAIPQDVLAEIAEGDATWWVWDSPIVLFRHGQP